MFSSIKSSDGYSYKLQLHTADIKGDFTKARQPLIQPSSI